MTVPVKDDSDARYAAVKLGELLADVTVSLTATEIHAMIVTRLRRSDFDERLARVVAGASEFTNLWNALIQGLHLPEAAWPTVALPTIVAFSSPKTLKARLELATSLWIAAQGGVQEQVAEPGEIDQTAEHPQIGPAAEPGAADRRPTARAALTFFPTAYLSLPALKRRWPGVLVALVLVAMVVAGYLWYSDESTPSNALPPGGSPISTSQPQQSLTPGAQASPSPSALPTSGDTSSAPPSTGTPPSANWTGTAAAVAPTAPLSVTVRGVTQNSVALSWQPPSAPGSGDIAYYRIVVDGADKGWTSATRSTINNLSAGATYTFTVVAHNAAGLASPPSHALTVTTLVPPTGAPAPAPTFTIDPSGSIPLGNSFTVTGAGLPCVAPQNVRIFLGGHPVAVAQLTAEGGFSVSVPIDNSEPATPRFRVLTTGEQVTLTAGVWPITVKLASQPPCQVTANYPAEVTFS
ncbi:hypothetical protein Rhe02_90410 [Rhizocola hellebori]|uniref:Fibronectin type-III domain-containing protein n=1 Tax=Rhizocola hellebori TaxID=1392758 RepID=A0A8J3VKZ1_9ACTN|nr:fibronectin type III domain-containing protein [Rhizocola hellebori]GIH10974.1 hypothetical protein Rhe02_90410 [Rhizocola hellebori]